MALRKKHVTVITRILFKVRTEASKKYKDDPEILSVAFGLIDTIGLLIAIFLETEISNFKADKFLFRFGYGTGTENKKVKLILDSPSNKSEQI